MSDYVRFAVNDAVDGAVDGVVHGAVGGAVGDAVGLVVDGPVWRAVDDAVWGEEQAEEVPGE